MYLVPFISNRWEQLSHARGSGDEVRIALETLFDPRESEVSVERALDTVNDLIFHQQSTYESTYVAVPYLVRYMERVDRRSQHQIVDLVTWISTQGDPHGELRNSEIDAYHEALEQLEPKAQRLFLDDGEIDDCDSAWLGEGPVVKWCDTWNSLNLLGRLATLRGFDTVGNHLRMGEEETDFQCGDCKTQLQSRGRAVSFEEGLCPSQYLLNYSEEFESQYLLPIARVAVMDGNEAEPVTIYPRTSFDNLEPESPAAQLHRWAIEAGHKKIAQWLRHFFGFVHCPNCGFKNDLAIELT